MNEVKEIQRRIKGIERVRKTYIVSQQLKDRYKTITGLDYNIFQSKGLKYE